MQGTVDSTGKAVDPAFYRTFWGLQAIFQQPFSAIHPDTWAKVHPSCKHIQLHDLTAAEPSRVAACSADAYSTLAECWS